VRRRRQPTFEQPSLVPMADMLTNTVGIMLFILIFASLSAGTAAVLKHLPREKPTHARAVWMYCSGGKIVHFEPDMLAEKLVKGLRKPSFSTADDWAHKFSSHTVDTDELQVSGEAETEYSGDLFQQSVRIKSAILVRRKPSQGEDEVAVKAPGSAFQRLLAEKNKATDFFFFYVDSDSIRVFRAARDKAATNGFGVGWTPLDANEPARIGLSGGGKVPTVQ